MSKLTTSFLSLGNTDTERIDADRKNTSNSPVISQLRMSMKTLVDIEVDTFADLSPVLNSKAHELLSVANKLVNNIMAIELAEVEKNLWDAIVAMRPIAGGGPDGASWRADIDPKANFDTLQQTFDKTMANIPDEPLILARPH